MIEDILTLAKQMIALPSLSGNREVSDQVLDLAVGRLRGFYVDEFEHEGYRSVLVSNAGKEVEHRLLLNAHLDVVAAGKRQFRPEVKSGKLYGRGAYDMKAAAAAMIVVFGEVARKVDVPVGLQLVSDEETSGIHGTKHQLDEGVRGNFVVIGEPTGFRIGIAAKGVYWLRLRTMGKSAHGAYPWLGENAIVKMQAVIGELLEAFPIPVDERWETTCSLGKIKGGETINTVPDMCEMEVDFRVTSQEEIKYIDSVLENLDVEVEKLLEVKEVNVEAEHRDVRALANAIKMAGEKVELVKMHGASDARHYSAIGIPAIEWGPRGGQHHGEGEYVEVKSLEKYAVSLREFILNLSR